MRVYDREVEFLLISFCFYWATEFLLPNKSNFRNHLNFIWSLKFLPRPLSPLTVSKWGNLCFVFSFCLLFLFQQEAVDSKPPVCWVSVLPGSHRMQWCCFLSWMLSYEQSSVNCLGFIKNPKFCVYLMYSVCQIDLGQFRQRVGRFLALGECKRLVSLD